MTRSKAFSGVISAYPETSPGTVFTSAEDSSPSRTVARRVAFCMMNHTWEVLNRYGQDCGQIRLGIEFNEAQPGWPGPNPTPREV